MKKSILQYANFTKKFVLLQPSPPTHQNGRCITPLTIAHALLAKQNVSKYKVTLKVHPAFHLNPVPQTIYIFRIMTKPRHRCGNGFNWGLRIAPIASWSQPNTFSVTKILVPSWIQQLSWRDTAIVIT